MDLSEGVGVSLSATIFLIFPHANCVSPFADVCSGTDTAEFADNYASHLSAKRSNNDFGAIDAQIPNLALPVIADTSGACFGLGLA